MTDAPVDTSKNESSRETWLLLEQVLSLVKQLLKPNTGRYLTHFNGKSVPKLKEEYEHILNNLRHQSITSLKSTFSRSESFVPSFQEVWIFYQLCMVETKWTMLLFLLQNYPIKMHKYNNFYIFHSMIFIWILEISFEILAPGSLPYKSYLWCIPEIYHLYPSLFLSFHTSYVQSQP